MPNPTSKNCCAEQDIRLEWTRSGFRLHISCLFLRSSLAGACVSFSLGGTITTKTGNPLIVFYVAIAIHVAVFIYAVSVLPETFPKEKRNALSHMHPEPSTDGFPATTRSASLLIFDPLKMLIPTRKLDGTRNWRLAWCAMHAFVFMAAHSYASAAWLVIATSKYHLTPADVSSTNSFRFGLILFTPDWYLPHRYFHQQYDRLGADCPTTGSLFASVLPPENRPF